VSDTQSYKKETDSCACDRKCADRIPVICEHELEAAMRLAAVCAGGLVGLAAILIAAAWG